MGAWALVNALAWSMAQCPVIISKEVASEMEGDRTSALQLELAPVRQAVNDGLGISTCNQKVIHANSNAFAVVPFVSHLDIRFCLGGEETHLAQNIRKARVPSQSA